MQDHICPMHRVTPKRPKAIGEIRLPLTMKDRVHFDLNGMSSREGRNGQGAPALAKGRQIARSAWHEDVPDQATGCSRAEVTEGSGPEVLNTEAWHDLFVTRE